jgi:hypothetical protein
LLFGLLALQNNVIERETLQAGFNAWVADKSQSLGQILLDRITGATFSTCRSIVWRGRAMRRRVVDNGSIAPFSPRGSRPELVDPSPIELLEQTFSRTCVSP